MADSFPSTTSQLYNALKISSEYILQRLPKAEVSIILGSGITEFYLRIENLQSIPFHDIPYLPVPTVSGHKGTLYHGTIHGKPIFCWGGRLHGYEGYTNFQISYIAHLSAFLGCNTLLITNASGCSMQGVKPGDIVLLKDYIKQFGKNTLDTGLHSLFTDHHSSFPFDESLRKYALNIGKRLPNIKVHEGTYFWVRGPSFETPYEVASYTSLGGDLYGMSTVPEILAGQAHGMRVLTAAVVTNLAAGLVKDEILTHELVKETIARVKDEIEEYFVQIMSELPPFEGEIRTEWTNEVIPKVLNQGRVEITEDQIRGALRWLRHSNEGRPNPSLAVVINSKQKFHLDEFRKVYYSEIPNFPQISYAARQGYLLIGNLESKNVIFLVNSDYEGLDTYEAYFLIKLLIGFGITHLHYIFPVLNLNESGVVGIDDYFSFHIKGCAEGAKHDSVRITSIGNHSVMAFPGPTFPTPAEYEMARRLNFDLVSIVSTSILSEASNNGLSHSASCYNCNFKEDFLTNFDISHALALNLSENTSEPLFWFPSQINRDDLSTFNYYPLETPQDLEMIAAEIKSSFSPIATIIISDTLGENLLNQFQITKSYTFGPWFPQTLHFTSENLMIVKGSPILRHGDNHHRMLFPTFLSNLLGISKIFIFDEVSTCNEHIQLGTWIRINNQCGLVFFNPLFGPNINSWGVRFPDMSNLYSWNLDWKSAFISHRINCEEANLVYTSSEREAHGRALAKVGNVLGAGVLGKTGQYSAIITQHKHAEQEARKVLYLGYVSYDPIKDQKTSQPPDEHFIALKELIINNLN